MEQDTSDSAGTSFSVATISRDALSTCAAWPVAFAGRRKDHRYYEILEDTIRDRFVYRYFAIVDGGGRVRAVQPFFLLDQDLLEGFGPQWRWVAAIRRHYPRFLKLRTLMVGCTAGEGHMAEGDGLPASDVAAILSRGIVVQARALGATMIVLKEFPKRDREALDRFVQRGFGRAPSMPMTTLDIDYDSFEDYMCKALSARIRRSLRKKFRAADQAGLRMTASDNVTSFVDEIYPLYLQVYQRSSFHFEKLTADYFRQLGERMGDKARFFMWHRGNTLMAFALCMVEGEDLFAEYIGLDYAFALDLHLYHYISREIICWAMAHGYKRLRSSGLNYDPKQHLRHRLDPIDLYVRHTSPLANLVMRLALPWLVPARYDATLRKFANYRQMW